MENYEIIQRNPHNDEFELKSPEALPDGALDELLDVSFATQNYRSQFPQVFAPGRERDWIVLAAKAKPVAMCTIYPVAWAFRTGEGAATGLTSASRSDTNLARGYCIGSVCTHPDYRKLGLAGRVIRLAEERARERCGDFLFLFSGKPELYASAGFSAVGKEWLAVIEPYAPMAKQSAAAMGHALRSVAQERKRSRVNGEIVHFEAEKLERTGFARSRELMRLATHELTLDAAMRLWRFTVSHEKYCDSILGFQEFWTLMQIPRMDCLVVTKGPEIMACGFLGKGIDYESVVHGICFQDKKDVFWMLEKLRQSAPQEVFVFAPGPFASAFEGDFSFMENSTLLVKSLNQCGYSLDALRRYFRKPDLYVRSLHSS